MVSNNTSSEPCLDSSWRANAPSGVSSGKVPFVRKECAYVMVGVRTDLPLAQQAVQAIHAAMACASASHKAHVERLVMVSACSEKELRAQVDALGQRGHDVHAFHEPDNDWGWTAWACRWDGPPPSFTRRWPLWSPG